jgi:hypothetical protein
MENLFFMQHYGVPTRLLDWTENPFIGLYFALTSAKKGDAKKYKDDAAVWILDPLTWNEHSLGKKMGGDEGILGPRDTDASGYAPSTIGGKRPGIMRDDPVCMYGVSNSPRMVAQKGVFTMFGRTTAAMEKTFEDRNYPNYCLQKVLIPKGCIDDLRDAILATGVTDSAIYPDLQGLALEIRRAFGFRL